MAKIKITINDIEKEYSLTNIDAKNLIELCFRLEALKNYEINEEAENE